MSAGKLRVVFAPLARTDLRDILRYTEQMWGRGRRNQYRQDLADGIAELALFPDLGKVRPDYGPNRRSIRIREHVVIYSVADGELHISRIVHVRRDIENLLADNA
jgi:toxin ParE1/3/4